jgi:glycosyltransferase involved in cell wall biosynthesis
MRRLLVFNLATDADDPVLGFTTVWLNRLAAHYDAVDVITMRAGRLAVADNVQVWSVGKECGYSEARRAAEFFRLLQSRLSQHRYVACFAHMMPLFAVLGAPQLRAAGVPVTLWYTHRSRGRMVRAAVSLVRRVVTAAPDSFPVLTPKLRVLGHGVDTTFFAPAALTPQLPRPEGEGETRITPSVSPRPEGERQGVRAAGQGARADVVQVARLMPIKHQATLIRALPAAPDWRAVFVGDVPPGKDPAYPGRLQALAAELGVADRVMFVGALPADGVRDAYRAGFAAVNLSPAGLFDKAALEAMACALPTLVSNPAFDDLLGENVQLLRVANPEDADGLSERLRALAALPEAERSAIGLRLRERTVAAHSLDGLIARLVRVLETGEPA